MDLLHKVKPFKMWASWLYAHYKMQCLECSLLSPFFPFVLFFFFKLEISWVLGLSSEMILTGNFSFTNIKFAKKLTFCVHIDVMTEVLFLQDTKYTDLLCTLGINKKWSAIISRSRTLPHLLLLFHLFCFTSRDSNAIRPVWAAASEQHPPSQGRFLPASCQAGPGNVHCDCIAAGPNQPRPGAQEYPSSGMLLQPPLCGRRQAFHSLQLRKMELSSFVPRAWKSGVVVEPWKAALLWIQSQQICLMPWSVLTN